MYNKEYFYGITDLMHFNVYASLLKEHITKEERVIIKVFKKNNEVVIIETNNFKDTYIKDTREDKESDLMEFDLTFLKVLERYYSDYEVPGMIYEYIEGIGSWYRVKIEGYNPEDKLLKPFFLKKTIQKEDLVNYCKTKKELNYLSNFYDITKGLIKFSKEKNVKELFSKIEE
ncbi:MAG TPA: hypothetical protein DCE23_01740 [Firmicutes bacterium]|nr:hypothetical protein [Bacillota bacterium]